MIFRRGLGFRCKIRFCKFGVVRLALFERDSGRGICVVFGGVMRKGVRYWVVEFYVVFVSFVDISLYFFFLLVRSGFMRCLIVFF